jgi:hypothetical protein
MIADLLLDYGLLYTEYTFDFFPSDLVRSRSACIVFVSLDKCIGKKRKNPSRAYLKSTKWTYCIYDKPFAGFETR